MPNNRGIHKLPKGYAERFLKDRRNKIVTQDTYEPETILTFFAAFALVVLALIGLAK